MKLFTAARLTIGLFSKASLLTASALCAFALSNLAYADSTKQPSIAIVIDDLGHHRGRGEALIALPYPLTFAFLPGRLYTPGLAQKAFQSGKEIMLHAPMENSRQFALGAGALTSNMDKEAVQSSLKASLGSIPHIVGVNNHMGSLLTSKADAMEWVMETLSEQPYYFLDSKTSALSIAAKTARQHGIPTLVRDVFLDHEQSTEYLEKQFEKLIKIARENGSAIAIGHPYKVTIEFLQKTLPLLDEQGITLATVSGLWQIQHPTQAMFPSVNTDTKSKLAFSGEF